jgi:hypothetical protein
MIVLVVRRAHGVGHTAGVTAHSHHARRSSSSSKTGCLARFSLARSRMRSRVSRARIDEFRGSSSDAAVSCQLQRGAGVRWRPARLPLLVSDQPRGEALAGLLPLPQLLGRHSPQQLELSLRRWSTRPPSGSAWARRRVGLSSLWRCSARRRSAAAARNATGAGQRAAGETTNASRPKTLRSTHSAS